MMNVLFTDEWKDHPETKEIAKLQQQFSDLKQWRLNENCAQCELERESSEDTDEDSDTDNSLQMFNPYLLLQQED